MDHSLFSRSWVFVVASLFLTKLLIRIGLGRWLPSLRRLSDGGNAFLHHYADDVLCAPHGDLRDLGEFEEIHGADAVNLALGEPRFDLTPSASTKLPAERRRRPPLGGLPELREAVADKLNRDQNLTVHPSEEVLITPGLSGAFHISLNTFINPGVHVALFAPASPLYHLAIKHRRARIDWISTWVESGRTRFHMEPLVCAMRKARLLVINSPANPTGGILAEDDLEQIAWWANRRNVLIFNDEVYERFIYEGVAGTQNSKAEAPNPKQIQSAKSQITDQVESLDPSIRASNSRCLSIGTLPKAKQRTLTAGSVSKGYGLASARVGWVAGHRHLIRPCALTAAMQSAWVPTLCQQIATTALRQAPDAFQAIRRDFDSRRHYTVERLRSMGLNSVWPAGGFFVWLPVRELGFSGLKLARELLQAKKVLVTPGELFGPGGEGYVRISYATDDGRLREGLTRLAEFVRDIRARSAPERRRAA